ncbi:BNR/Asp-box repeat-containing protein [Halovenus aranensis]|uniref:BNR/Asp-box repeat-containing protein n=1 Tax=Halovenus aranensis TaxID=890420 RepID=A0A1G8W9X6_9EURY|nr:sialidase family protein [Halovenus aranensis]SDJ75074.1 BNR/Asp-box repeat-containing protein [Halovenus aranensis]
MRAYAALDDRLVAVSNIRTGPSSREVLVGFEFECLAASRSRPEQVLAGTVESGLQRSTDGGTTWDTLGVFDDRVTAATVSPHDPDVVWVGTEPSAVYRSTDGGDTWSERGDLTDLPSAEEWAFPPRPHTHHVRWLAVDPQDSATVYAAIEAGAFLRSTDAGQAWEPRPAGARLDNHTLATHPDAPGRVYAAAGDGYAESADGGRTWQYPEAGLDHGYVWGLAVDSADPERVVVSAADGARSAHTPARAETYLYRRTPDGGWERAMDGYPEGTVRAVLAAGVRAGEFAALTNRGVYWSDDGGDSWSRLAVEWPEEDLVGRGLALVEDEEPST